MNAKLIFLRSTPLIVRPLIVILEGAYVSQGHLLVIVMPIAMMALTISSIPIHMDFYQSNRFAPEWATLGAQYVSALMWVTLTGLMVLCAVLLFPGFQMSAIVVVITCIFFFIEKLADEISRMLTFHKAFTQWFLVQSIRSGWMLLPIAASQAGVSYKNAFLVAATLTAMGFAALFIKVTGLRPRFSLSGLMVIRDNLIFLVGSILPASYRQLPRILVARLFPEQAHIFLATAQLTQGVGLVFNVRFQIPYRKLIARKTQLFQKLVQPAMLRQLLIPALIAPVWMIGAMLLSVDAWTGIALGVALFPLLVADSLMFAILAAHLGYLPWFERRNRVFVTYVINAALLLGLMMVYKLPQIADRLSIFTIMSSFIVLGLAWLVVILARHFTLRQALNRK